LLPITVQLLKYW